MKVAVISQGKIEAAARAYMEWQFPQRSWDSLTDGMREKFREGARNALVAAADASDDGPVNHTPVKSFRH